MSKKPKQKTAIIGANIKPIVVAILALLVVALPALSAQKVSPSATETTLQQSNAYTALKWDFGSAGRKYGQNDTLTFVADSAASVQYIRTSSFGPKARNQQAVNLYLPDSLRLCVEMARVDADTNTTLAFFQASVNGGTYFPFPVIAAGTTTEIPVAGRGFYCVTRLNIPAVFIKPQQVITTATDTNNIYSALLFGIYK